MTYDDHYKYLGCKLGANARAEVNQMREQYLKEAKIIFDSHFTDWQKLNALHRLLNHCHYLMGIRTRHGEILKMIRRAIPRDMGDVFLEQQIPGDPEHNRPDLAVVNCDRSKIIVVMSQFPLKLTRTASQ